MTNDIISAQPEAEQMAEEQSTDIPVSGEEAIPNPEQAKGIEVKFNKKMLRLSESEARDYAEKGMKYDSLIPVLNRLKELSPDSSMSLGQLADHLFKEKEEKARLAEQAAENGGRQDRLTAQFLELKAKFPEISIREVPKSVIELSLKGEIPLYYAYLGYLHDEESKTARSQLSAQKAENAAAVDLNDAPDRLSSPEIAAMLRGIWA